MKYDSADCKITEGENALSVLADKRQTQESGRDDVRRQVWVGPGDNLQVTLVCGCDRKCNYFTK